MSPIPRPQDTAERLPQVKRTPLYEQVYDILLERIKNGHLPAGEIVDAQSIADSLGISRTPVREAIRNLVQVGVLEADGNLRARVYLPNVNELAEIYQIRSAMYSVTAQTVAVFHAELDLTYLRSSVPTHINELEPEQIADANNQFHRELVRLSTNQASLKLQSTMSLQVRQYRHFAMRYPERRSGSVKDHQQILQLIEQGNAEGARRETYAHILRAGAWAICHLAPDPSRDSMPMRFLRSYADSATSDQ